jgi:16S rRNA (guanine(966)-N(2))-methyltransferase RsmD
VRITGGNFRGRIIHAPDNLPVRPTTDFAKTALFNILNNYFDFEKLTVLDLFAGTGSIAYEFASRDAVSITCVDKNADCIRFIKKTAALLKADSINCVQSDVFKYIGHENSSYDIIFADPPYDLVETDKLPELIFEKNLLKKDGWLIIEHQSKRILESSIQPNEIRKYSNCAFSIFI